MVKKPTAIWVIVRVRLRMGPIPANVVWIPASETFAPRNPSSLRSCSTTKEKSGIGRIA